MKSSAANRIEDKLEKETPAYAQEAIHMALEQYGKSLAKAKKENQTETDTVSSNRTYLSLYQLVDSAIDLATDLAKEKRVHFMLKLKCNPLIEANESELAEALGILFRSALRRCRDGSQINVEGYLQAHHLHLDTTISDPHNLTLVRSSSRHAQRDTLYRSQEIIEAHMGMVSAINCSELNTAKFEIILPTVQ